VQNADDLDKVFADAIDRQKWQAGNDQLTRILLLPGAARVRKLSQRTQAFVDAKRHLASGGWTVMLFYVVTDSGKVTRGRFRPSDAH
jgi:hypothetical protein